MTIQYSVSVPHKDISNGWIIIKTFNTRELAADFANIVWGAEDGYICLISRNIKYFSLKIPNPDYVLTNDQFLRVRKFDNKADALSFAIENYEANNDGCISLISKINFSRV